MKDNFEKSIQSLFEHPPEISFDEEGWKSLESRLKESKSNRKYGLWLWLPLILGAASALFALGYAYAKAGVQPLPSKTITAIIPDGNDSDKKQQKTTKEIVIVHDTIIRTITKYTTNPPKVTTLSPLSPLWGASFYQPNLSNLTGKFGRKEHSVLEQSRIREANKILDSDDQNVSSSLIDQPIESIKPQFLSRVDQIQGLSLSPVFVREQGNSASYYLRKLIPKDFNVTIYDGGFNNLNFNSPAGTQKNSSYGFRARLGYWRRWSVVLGMEALKSTFDIYADRAGSAAIFSDLPQVPPTTVVDRLHEVMGAFSYFQIPLGIQCDIPIKGSFESFVSAGLTLQKTKTSILTYDYFSIGEEYGIEKGSLIPPAFKLNSYWFETGIRFYVGSRWSIEGALGGQFSFKNKTFRHESLNDLKWHLGLGFDF